MKIESIKRPWEKQGKYGKRYNPDPFYQSNEWKTIRARKLSMSPYCECENCKGKNIKAEMVDHIIPISQGGSPTDMNNLQSMRNRCHHRKSAIEKNAKYSKI